MAASSRAPWRQMCETRGVGQAAYHLGTIAAVPYASDVKGRGNVAPRDRNAWFISEADIYQPACPGRRLQAFFGARLGKLADPRASLSRNSHAFAALPA